MTTASISKYTVSTAFKMEALPNATNFITNRMFVANFDKKISPNDLKLMFERYGEISSINVKKNTRRPFGFITFKDPKVCEKVLEEAKEEPLKINGRELYMSSAFFLPKRINTQERKAKFRSLGPNVIIRRDSDYERSEIDETDYCESESCSCCDHDTSGSSFDDSGYLNESADSYQPERQGYQPHIYTGGNNLYMNPHYLNNYVPPPPPVQYVTYVPPTLPFSPPPPCTFECCRAPQPFYQYPSSEPLIYHQQPAATFPAYQPIYQAM